MTDEILKIKVNDIVQTPYGPGVVQGRLVERDGSIGGILISHDPRKVTLPDELLAHWKGGPWVLWSYPLEQLRILAKRKMTRA
jgi:hypothetical protein